MCNEMKRPTFFFEIRSHRSLSKHIYCRDARFCRQHEQNNVWPTAVQLHTKLYGSKKELEKELDIHLADRTFSAAAIEKNKPHSHAREQPVLRELFGLQSMASINNK